MSRCRLVVEANGREKKAAKNFWANQRAVCSLDKQNATEKKQQKGLKQQAKKPANRSENEIKFSCSSAQKSFRLSFLSETSLCCCKDASFSSALLSLTTAVVDIVRGFRNL